MFYFIPNTTLFTKHPIYHNPCLHLQAGFDFLSSERFHRESYAADFRGDRVPDILVRL